MTTPTTIILPGIVTHLERFLRPLGATSGDGVEIRQDASGTTVSACEGRHSATITTRGGGSLDPILMDVSLLADLAPVQPVKLYRMTETSGALLRGDGELVSIEIRPGTLPQSARDMADVVEGEIASGMTRNVFELDPRHLLAVAEAAVATGAEKMTISVAPRWNVLACMAETETTSAAFLVAGESFAEPDTDEPDSEDPLAFTIGGGNSLTTRRRSRPDKSSTAEDDIPW